MSSSKKTAKPRPGYRNHNPKRAKGGRNDELIVLDRQRQVAECYLKGMTQMEVVEELGRRGIAVSQPTVSNDLRDIFSRWEVECVTEFEKARLREIEGINQLEAFAWQELEFSRVRRVKIQPPRGAKDQEVKIVEERQLASTEWHEQIKKCKELRIKLLGLIKTETVNNNSVNIVDPGFWAKMTEPPREEDPVEALIAGVRVTDVVASEVKRD